MSREAYKVGWDFVIGPKQQWQPPPKSAASNTDEDPSCNITKSQVPLNFVGFPQQGHADV